MSRPLLLLITAVLAVSAVLVVEVRYVLITLAILGIVIVVHELSHLVAARLLGVRALAFGFGFGPVLLERRMAGIDWRWRLLPVGGYVALAGESDGDVGPGSYASAGRKRRTLIALAGPLSNLLLAWIILIALFASHGADLVWASSLAADFLGDLGAMTYSALAGWLPRAVSAPLDMPFSGLPGMVQGVGTIVTQPDPGVMLSVLAAALSFSLGIFNLLPIPPLDGGRVACDLLASYGDDAPSRRRDLRHGFEKWGFVSMIALVVLVTGIDIVRVVIDYQVTVSM